jgi:uncharacterized repeat protein (TIGR03806 family)
MAFSSLLLTLSVASACTSCAPQDAPERVRWTNSRLLGSPEPPAAYGVEKTFSKIEWKLPLYVAPEPGTNKLWVVQQGGGKSGVSRIRCIDNDPATENSETIFELSDRLIYGLTFHPSYEANGFVYVFTNGPTDEKERTNRVTRYKISRQAPHSWDVDSGQVIVEWRSMGHDGGDLAFGQDHMLYITAGDGTTDSDTWNSGQDVSNLLATLIRIDVDHPAPGQAYSVPRDNPFLDVPGARPEIWAFGFRNPWRMSIDSKTGDVWVGNNGQDLWETAYCVRRGDNFGWSVYEGSHPFYPNRKRGPAPIVPPTIEHHHSEFRSLTGGVVYYGDKFPELNGAYIYGDYSTGKIWGARHKDYRLVWHQELTDTSLQIVAFRVDQDGELLVVDIGGGIYRLTRRSQEPNAAPFPTRLSETGLFASVRDHRIDPGLIAYSVNAPGWADGATAERFLGVSGDSKIAFRVSRGWQFPDEAVLVQTLSLPGAAGGSAPARRIETRVMVKQQGEWAGYSYKWNDDQSDAVLVVKEGETLTIDVGTPENGSRRQTWRVPSRAECLVCHSRAVNFVLGPSDAQMNRDRLAGDRTENQVAVLDRLGVLSDWPPKPPKEKDGSDKRVAPLVNPYDESQDLDSRARAYLHTNCSVCHVEAGGGNAKMELESQRPREQMSLFGARPQHDTFDIPNAMLIAPGEPDRSVLLHRVSRRGRGQMPPLVTSHVDEAAVKLLRDWIAQMKADNAFVRAWTTGDLLPDLDRVRSGRSFESGKKAFESVGCNQCHRLGGDGGTVGPDLGGVSKRLSLREILESITEPSKVVADEYAATIFETARGTRITGRIEREEGDALVIRTGPADSDVVRLAKSEIEDRRKSSVSNMPMGTINVLEKNQILDLMSYILSEANPESEVFRAP